MADDTGLFVDALGGAPGVWTARYAGEGATYADNRAKLLAALAGVADRGRRRSAPWRWCAGRRATSSSSRVCARGRSPRTLRPGRGFGYDPLFVPDEGDGRTFAEMTADEKNAISHRGRAFAAPARHAAALRVDER